MNSVAFGLGWSDDGAPAAPDQRRTLLPAMG